MLKAEDFAGVNLYHVPPPTNFFCFLVSRTGVVTPLTKKVLDSVFINAIQTNELVVPLRELPKYYVLLCSAGKILKQKDDLTEFTQEDRIRFKDLRREEEMRDEAPQYIYAYNRSYRTVYRYEFYLNDYGEWLRAPEEKKVLTEVGPVNYYR